MFAVDRLFCRIAGVTSLQNISPRKVVSVTLTVNRLVEPAYVPAANVALRFYEKFVVTGTVGWHIFSIFVF